MRMQIFSDHCNINLGKKCTMGCGLVCFVGGILSEPYSVCIPLSTPSVWVLNLHAYIRVRVSYICIPPWQANESLLP